MMDLKETLALIKTGSWISLRCITADVAKGTGGRVLELPKVRLAKIQHATKSQPTNEISTPKKRKNPRHHVHFTLNMELDNGLLRKVHPILITHINNKAVL